MTSVIRKTNGHSSTPLVNDSEPLCPNRFQLNGVRPSVGSSAKIFTPTNSAIIALHDQERREHDEQARGARIERPTWARKRGVISFS